MSYISKEEIFEDLWDQMEELSKSCDRADGKLSRGIARYLVGYIDLPQSYRIRAHMALTSVLCAQDTLRDAEKDYAEVQVKVSAGRHAQIQAELHATSVLSILETKPPMKIQLPHSQNHLSAVLAAKRTLLTSLSRTTQALKTTPATNLRSTLVTRRQQTSRRQDSLCPRDRWYLPPRTLM